MVVPKKFLPVHGKICKDLQHRSYSAAVLHYSSVVLEAMFVFRLCRIIGEIRTEPLDFRVIFSFIP